MSKYTLTVKIVNAGTIYINESKVGKSDAGHMWYSISDGNSSNSFGFGRVGNTKEGDVVEYDDIIYQSTHYTATIDITQKQYDTLIDYGKNSERYGFNKEKYNVLTNSCIDFTWKALEVVGIGKIGFEGDLIPRFNANDVDERFFEITYGSSKDWSYLKNMFNPNINSIFGSNRNDNIIAKQERNNGNYFVYGGDGSDTIDLRQINRSKINTIYADYVNDDNSGGNDTIYGGKGKDIIYGGNGFDTYYVGDKDEIIDSDDNGRVFFNNLPLGESKQSSENPNVYISKDYENIQYELKGSNLIITNTETKESFTIKNYSKDKQSLGITLGDKSKVEMAFLSDTTGSMGGAINSVKSQIKELVDLAFSKDINTRIGVFGYNDPYTETFTYLTNDKASIINAINSLYASGGGDYPELTYSGIIRAASANWSYGADKRLFLFGDAIAKDSHLKDEAFGLLKPNKQKERAIDILKKEGIKVYAIYTGYDDEAFNEFKELALATNGDYFQLDDDSLVADKIFDAMNYGTSSNDVIEGNDKDNSLNGFGGDDTLVGKAGSDTYTFTGLNFGNDTIIESNLNNIDKNTIIFKDVSYKDVRFKKDLNDLKITLNKDNSVTIKDFYNTNNESKISSISFSDVTLDELAIKRSVSMQANKEAIIFLKEKDFSFSNFATSTFAVAYQDNASNISTSYKDDVIIGSNKNDVISTKLGNDTLIGGKGDDKLYGGFGNDIYVYRKGDGNDLIYDDGGQDALKLQNLKADEIFLIKDGKDLLIKFKDDDTNSIRVAHHFAWKFGYHNQINTIELDDDKFINTKTIDKLIEQTSAFAKNNGIDIHNINHINDDRLNQIYMSAWN